MLGETEWVLSDEAGIRDAVKALGQRRARLLSVACCRLVLSWIPWPGDETARTVLEACEAVADGGKPKAHLPQARQQAKAVCDGYQLGAAHGLWAATRLCRRRHPPPPRTPLSWALSMHSVREEIRESKPSAVNCSGRTATSPAFRPVSRSIRRGVPRSSSHWRDRCTSRGTSARCRSWRTRSKTPGATVTACCHTVFGTARTSAGAG
jgi:hypothetical protein